MKNRKKFSNKKRKSENNQIFNENIETSSETEENAKTEENSTSSQTIEDFEAKNPEKTAAKSSEYIFALDIGTRSVIGIVAEENAGVMKILATVRKEHQTRAMLDGQIHDVPEVAALIGEVKSILEEQTVSLNSAAVAAAGRSLYTMRGEAEVNINNVITKADEENLEFLGVQKAQSKLANSKTVDDISEYYCVGYSTISYELDGIELKSLVGQRGNTAKVSVIATFLPRQVIDSMQSALANAGLNMRALTLEPIAAINVLIPPTMRHLNLALVDIGAGTSDVALTKDGSVFAYGMVPLAGDEITEALSKHFLLDFKVAESVKRKATKGESAEFSDILGINYNLTADEIIKSIEPAVKSLAEAIAQEIINLNGSPPQATILVGGGALTPNLSAYLAEILNMPKDKVAVRKPDKVEGIEELPAELQTSDSVTPLGILKIASANTLHFFKIFVNGKEHDLFNFRDITVSDALLNAGVNLKKYNGRPSLALTITIDGKTKFFPGNVGSLALVKVNGEDATMDTVVKSGDKIEIVRGKDGSPPKVYLKDVVSNESENIVRVNGKDVKIAFTYAINGKNASMDAELNDGDTVTKIEENTVGAVLNSEGLSYEGKRMNYTLNGAKSHFNLPVEILLNGNIAKLSDKVKNGDVIKCNVNDSPTLKEVLDIGEQATSLRITFNNKEYHIPTAGAELTVNGKSATEKTKITDGANIVYKETPQTTTVSDALLAVNFQPPPATSRMKFDILVNGRSAEFIDPVKNGDSLEVVLTKIGEPSPVKKAEEKPQTNKPPSKETKETPISEIKDLADRAVPITSFKERFKNATKNFSSEPKTTKPLKGVPNIPGLSDAIAASKLPDK